MTNARCRCGGSRVHHANDIACWCPRCLRAASAQRCTEYTPLHPLVLPPPPPHAGDLARAKTHTELVPQPADTRSEHHEAILREVEAAGDAGCTAGELSALLRIDTKAVAAELVRLSDSHEVVRAATPRTVGASSEDVWLAVRPQQVLDPHQATLWA